MALALITGASSGFGSEFARLFARDGHDLVLIARRRDRLEELARELEAKHAVHAHVIPIDLAGPDAVTAVIDDLSRKGLGDVEFLINNAGFGSSGAFAERDPAGELQMVQLNISTLVGLTRALLPSMLRRRSGRILNIGSTAGFQPGPYMAVYYASKAFVNSFTEALAYELRGTGVTATVSCPGASATGFATRAGTEKSWLFRLPVAPAAGVCRQAYRAMMSGRPMIVHGVLNWLVIQSERLVPRALVRFISAGLNR